MTLLYVGCVVGGGAMLLFREELADSEMPMAEVVITGGVLLGMGVVLAAMFAAAFVLPRRPWVWIYHIVLIGLGMTSCCCLPATIPLLIYWIRPEVKAHFNVLPAGAPLQSVG